MNPTLSTLKMLQRAKVVITDPAGFAFESIIDRLKYELNREANQGLYA